MNRKNKGFTLIELLAVIIILAVILVIASTSVLKSKKDAEKKLKYTAAKEIVEMAEAYMAANNKEQDSHISVVDMCNSGYVSDDATNPATGKNITECSDLFPHQIVINNGDKTPTKNYELNTDNEYVFEDYVYELNGAAGIAVIPVDALTIINENGDMVSGTINLKINESYQINAEVSPENATNRNIDFKSGDSNVATVDSSGNIVAKATGNTTISVTPEGNANKKKTFDVIVTNGDVLASSISFKNIDESNKIKLTPNNSFKVIANITPDNAADKSIAWTSSNDSVATVDSSGNIVAKAAGTTTITAKTSNGKSANVTVTVENNNNVIQATGISLDKAQFSMLLNSSVKTKKVTATVSPANTTNKSVTWTSSNTSVATVATDGTITAKGIGKATITAKTSNGKKASVTVTVKQNVIVVVGASQVTRMASYAKSYKKGNNEYSVDKKTLVYNNLSGTGIPWQYATGTDKNGKPKGLTRTEATLGGYNKTYTKFYVIYPLAGNTIQNFICSEIINIDSTLNGYATVKGYVDGYNGAVSKLKKSGYNVTAYVTAMHPVRAKDREPDPNNPDEEITVVNNTDENACASKYRSNYKYYVFNETIKYLINEAKPDYKYISVFEDIMDLNGAKIKVGNPSTINPIAFSYKKMVDDDGEFSYTTDDGIHWDSRTTRTYLRMILDKVSGL